MDSDGRVRLFPYHLRLRYRSNVDPSFAHRICGISHSRHCATVTYACPERDLGVSLFNRPEKFRPGFETSLTLTNTIQHVPITKVSLLQSGMHTNSKTCPWRHLIYTTPIRFTLHKSTILCRARITSSPALSHAGALPRRRLHPLSRTKRGMR